MLWLIIAALTSPAHADAFTLANGSVVEGTLATYELGGNCQIFVASGPVRGATLLLPCDEILSFARPGSQPPQLTAVTPAAAPLAPPLLVEEVAAPVPIVVPIDPPTQAPSAVELPPAEPTPAATLDGAAQPYAASLPEGYALPGDDALAEQVTDESGPAAAQPEAPAAPPPANLRGTPRAAPVMGAPDTDDATAPVDEGAAAPDEETPEGWRQKGQGGMPRWLQRALYGDEAVPQEDGSPS